MLKTHYLLRGNMAYGLYFASLFRRWFSVFRFSNFFFSCSNSVMRETSQIEWKRPNNYFEIENSITVREKRNTADNFRLRLQLYEHFNASMSLCPFKFVSFVSNLFSWVIAKLMQYLPPTKTTTPTTEEWICNSNQR